MHQDIRGRAAGGFAELDKCLVRFASKQSTERKKLPILLFYLADINTIFETADADRVFDISEGELIHRHSELVFRITTLKKTFHVLLRARLCQTPFASRAERRVIKEMLQRLRP